MKKSVFRHFGISDSYFLRQLSYLQMSISLANFDVNYQLKYAESDLDVILNIY